MVQFQAREYSLGCQLHSPRPKHHSSPTVAMGTRTVSWEELSRHNTPDDLWIAIAGVAYDVTNWGDSHPGGKMVFERSAGRDVTEPFQAYHPDWVAGTMERFKVGVLETERRNPLPGATVAYIKLFKKIKEEGLLETDYSFYLWTGAWLACLFALAWGLVLSGQWVLGAVATALFWQQISFLGHDAGHNSITHNRKKDGQIGLLVNAFVGIGMSWWKSSHNIHHILVNSTDCDPDIQFLPLLAPSRDYLHTSHSLYHDIDMVFDSVAKVLIPYQHITFLPILLVAKYGMYLQSVKHFIIGGTVYIHKFKECAVLVFYLCWYLALVFMVPTWRERVLFVMLCHAHVFILHLQICLSHFSRHTFQGLPRDDDWMRCQLASTLNWRCPPWMDWFHGGLQFQIEHHLFPRVPRHNLRKVQAMVEPLCIELGLDYYCPGFLDAVWDTFMGLKKVADEARKVQ